MSNVFYEIVVSRSLPDYKLAEGEEDTELLISLTTSISEVAADALRSLAGRISPVAEAKPSTRSEVSGLVGGR